MESFVFAANSVLPLIALIFLGYVLKRIGFLNDNFLNVGNKLVFKILLPVLLFYNVYNIQSFEQINWAFVLYGAGAVFAFFVIGMVVVPLFVKDKSQCGVIIQGIFRSNFALIGVPLATSLFGADGAASASVLSAFAIPLFNILAVITLMVFQNKTPQVQNAVNNATNKSQSTFKKVLIGTITNPLILAVVSGLLVLLVRSLFVELGWSFRLKSFTLFGQDVTFIYKALQYVANTATPFSLIVLGGKFTISAVKRLWKPILATTLIRCVAVPAISLFVAYLLIPSLQGQHFAAYIAVFGTPTAVSSAIMAKEMGGDDELAGQIVVWTTIFSAFTIFVEIVILKAVGIF